MRCGRFMGYGYNGSYILGIILIFTVIIFYFLIRDYFKKKHNLNDNRLLNILNLRYIQNEVNAEEFMERKAIIEGEASKDFAVLILKERYIKGEIDSKEFYMRLNNLNDLRVKTDGKAAINFVKEKYAKGEITEEELARIKKKIM